MDLTIIKSDIKTWERSFKTKYSREPNVDDIKSRPDIANKYKLYKSLLKEAARQSSIASYDPPSTPPRKRVDLPLPSSIIPKSRATHGESNPFTPNPFSPAKSVRPSSSRQNDAMNPPLLHRDRPITPNARNRSLSPNPFQLPDSPSNIRGLDTSKNERSTIKRARKRLRGDATSPTPTRSDKKRRTTTLVSDSSLQDPLYSSARSRSSSQASSNVDEAENSYVEESPVKSMSSGKSFRLLFDDEYPRLDLTHWLLSDTNTRDPAFGGDNRKPDRKASENGRQKRPPHHSKYLGSRQGSMTDALPPGSSETAPLIKPDHDLHLPQEYNRKRSSSDVDLVTNDLQNEENKLLPPSPTAAPSFLPRLVKTGFGAPKGSIHNRKKFKTSASYDEDHSEDEQFDAHIFETETELRSRNKAQDSSNDELELELSVHKSRGFDYTQACEVPDAEVVDVDLPDNLRTILHISSSHSREREERALVDSLLLGETSADKYGEIWGLGEVDVSASVTDEEEDWAGEGVPWEAAEL